MTDTAEFRHILSFVQSHLDSQDVDMEGLNYDISNHVTEDYNDAGIPELEVTGTTVELTVRYSFDFD